MYEVTNNLPREQFIRLIVSLIVAAHDHFDEETDSYYRIEGIETLGHQLSCLFAQRIDDGVGTGDCITGLNLFDVPEEPDMWLWRVVKFLEQLQG